MGTLLPARAWWLAVGPASAQTLGLTGDALGLTHALLVYPGRHVSQQDCKAVERKIERDTFCGVRLIPNPVQLIAIAAEPPNFPAQQYAVHPQHRNQSPQKSQWTINIPGEYAVFQMGASSCGGRMQDAVYGLHLVNNQGAYLGVSPEGQDVLIAKFTRDADQWHGYPFLHTTPKRDVPRAHLDNWWASGRLRKMHYSRILRKQPC